MPDDLFDRVEVMRVKSSDRMRENREKFPEFAEWVDSFRGTFGADTKLQHVEFPDGKVWGEKFTDMLARKLGRPVVMVPLSDPIPTIKKGKR